MPEQVTVTVQDPATPAPEPVATIQLDKQPDPITPNPTDVSLKQLENRWAATERVNKKLQADLAELRNKLTQPAAPIAPARPESNLSDLDRLVETDWKGAVKQVVNPVIEQEVNRIIEQREQARLVKDAQTQRERNVAQAFQAVVEKYPALHPETGDAEDPISLAWTKAYNEHPEYHSNEFGAILTMQAMEASMKSKPGPAAPRRSAGLPPSRPAAGQGNTYSITKEQKDLIDHMGIPAEQYAKIAKTLESGESFEVA